MNRSKLIFFFIIASLIQVFQSCVNYNSESKLAPNEHEILNQDSLELVHAYQMQSKIKISVTPSGETDPVQAKSIEDAADDPAIWFNASQPSQSIIFGSNKRGGIVASNLDGKTSNYYPVGKVNNIDIVDDFILNGTVVSLLGGSNRSTQSISLFQLDNTGNLEQIFDDSFKMDSLKIDDVYGFCFAQGNHYNEHYIFINGKNGLMQQYSLYVKDGEIKLELEREIQFDSQTEGMVADKINQKIYVGEEDKGVWVLEINPKSKKKHLLPESGINNPNIQFDIEGITIYRKDKTAILFVSSQGNFSYALFDINNKHRYLGSFVINSNNVIDGVEETDGIAIISDSLSVIYPNGIFVAQDGFNYQHDSLTAQNFKIVDPKLILSNFKID